MGGGERGARGQRVRGNFNMAGGREEARVGGRGQEGGERRTEGQRKFYHGIRPFRAGRRTFMESGRRNFIMGYDPLGWGGDTHGIRKKKISWDTTL